MDSIWRNSFYSLMNDIRDSARALYQSIALINDWTSGSLSIAWMMRPIQALCSVFPKRQIITDECLVGDRLNCKNYNMYDNATLKHVHYSRKTSNQIGVLAQDCSYLLSGVQNGEIQFTNQSSYWCSCNIAEYRLGKVWWTIYFCQYQWLMSHWYIPSSLIKAR